MADDEPTTRPGSTTSASWSLPADVTAPQRARIAIGRALADLGSTEREDVLLLVSELVTNSVRHAPLAATETIDVRLERSVGRIRVEVHDPGAGFSPEVRNPDPDRPGGWGLHLTQLIAKRWGVESKDHTTVWFEVATGP